MIASRIEKAPAGTVYCMGEEFSMTAVNVEIRQTLHSLVRVRITLKVAVLDAMASRDSASELDSCGVCSGLGCVSSDPLKHSWCCDCAGLAFGSHIINICCECVNREVYWKALSDGILQGPPENHSLRKIPGQAGELDSRKLQVHSILFNGALSI